MPAKFQSSIHKREDITYLKLAGVIDEDNELGPLADQLHAGTVVIDGGEVERINSCGVRDWVNWLGRVEKNGGKVVLVECSPSIVAQVNLVNNFTGNGVVKSFYAPYFCPQCDREKVLLIETRDAVGQHPFRAPTCRCDECDGPMDFDDMEESYFAFLQNTSKIVTDARVDEFVTEFTPSEGGPKLRTKTGVNLTSTLTHTPTPSPSPVSSLPSVPPLPSIKRPEFGGNTGRFTLPGTNPGSNPGSTGRFDKTGPIPIPMPSPSADPSRRTQVVAPASFAPAGTTPTASAPQQSNRVWFAVGGLLLAIAVVLAVLVFRHT